MKANFINEITGELFHVTTHTSKYSNIRKRWMNIDVLGNTIVDPETAEELTAIPYDDQLDIDCVAIVTKASVPQKMSKGNREKAIKHFKTRADRHTKSDAGIAERRRSITREINSINKKKR